VPIGGRSARLACQQGSQDPQGVGARLWSVSKAPWKFRGHRAPSYFTKMSISVCRCSLLLLILFEATSHCIESNDI
jgi:hypothetical protein